MPRPTIMLLSEMTHGAEADFFVLMTGKEQLTTKTGQPYFKVAFRDAGREVSFPIWSNSPFAVDCRDAWEVGSFYKIRATYRDTEYGSQLDIRQIRPATDDDRGDGFDPAAFLPRTRFEPDAMLAELRALIETNIPSEPLRRLVLHIIDENTELLLSHPAARSHHHAYVGGLLEHTLCVAKSCVLLAGRYAEQYEDLSPPLDTGLVAAGGVLHDIGKLRELEMDPTGIRYSAEGTLIGHMLLGRDIVREAAAEVEIDDETRLRLEHLIIAHQRLPEWGSPKEPMTPEALIVHYADDLDAKFRMMAEILEEDTTEGPLTSRKNVLRHPVFRGFGEE